VEVIPWSEATEAEQVARFDIGIMPLADAPWERGKCGYKLIQYMACGKPVAASPVGVNMRIVQDWGCGLLADEHEQWFQALDWMLRNPDESATLGGKGRRAVEEHYSLQAQVPRLIDILREAAGSAA
jgi:glycosyltransferase involved in cell wall biosynthesis